MDQPLRPQVLLLGRTNVGKSTIFNRLTGKATALVADKAGTTRDYNIGLVNWQGHNFFIADSPGLDKKVNRELTPWFNQATERLLKQVQVALLVIDGQTGISGEEMSLIKRLYRSPKPTILVINKIDNARWRANAANIHLAFPEQIMISAQIGNGLGDLLDLVTKHLTTRDIPQPTYRFSLIGKTNVGKSSVFNRLLNQERSLILPTPHTTRDRQTDWLVYRDQLLELRDTAGVRRQLPQAPILEKLSVRQTLNSFTDSDGLILVLDGSQPATWQDQHLARALQDSGLPLTILLNKSDLVSEDDRLYITKHLKHYFPFVSFVPVIWVSALTGSGFKKIWPTVLSGRQQAERYLTTQELTDFKRSLSKRWPTQNLRLIGLKQTGVVPPSFTLQIKTKQPLPQALARWLEAALRQKFKFTGTPLRVRAQGMRKEIK